jgi:hypothetical protein
MFGLTPKKANCGNALIDLDKTPARMAGPAIETNRQRLHPKNGFVGRRPKSH